MFAGERAKTFRKIQSQKETMKNVSSFAMRPPPRCCEEGRNRTRRGEERGEEREIKMCLAQLYFIRRAQLLFSLLVNSRLAHS